MSDIEQNSTWYLNCAISELHGNSTAGSFPNVHIWDPSELVTLSPWNLSCPSFDQVVSHVTPEVCQQLHFFVYLYWSSRHGVVKLFSCAFNVVDIPRNIVINN